MKYSVFILSMNPNLTNPISTLAIHIQYNNKPDKMGHWGRYTVI